MTKIRFRRRKIFAPSSAEAKKEKVFLSMEKHIFNHPHFNKILEALREGVSVNRLSAWFHSENYLTVSERTFAEYLRVFKQRNSQLIERPRDIDTLDDLISSIRPDVDVVKELTRLYRLQKMRLAIDVKTEKNIGKLFNTTVKEVEISAKILELMGRATGLMGKESNSHRESDYDRNAMTGETYHRVLAEQQKTDRLEGLATQLAKRFQNVSTTKAKS